jgi:hypothetical protein
MQTSALPTIQMLWVQGRLSTLERLSITSFLRCGHPVHLYTYGLDAPPPPGTQLMDAREVMPQSLVFTHPASVGHGSYATFADIFRYKLLFQKGGIWCDTDMVCLKPLTFFAETPLFFSSEYVHPKEGTAVQPKGRANVGAIQAPAGHPLLRTCLEAVAKMDTTTAPWASTGPGLLDVLLPQSGLQDIVLKPEVFCSVPHWQLQDLISGARLIHPQAVALHFWNELWRRNFLDKDGQFEPLCIYERLKAHYLAP